MAEYTTPPDNGTPANGFVDMKPFLEPLVYVPKEMDYVSAGEEIVRNMMAAFGLPAALAAPNAPTEEQR